MDQNAVDGLIRDATYELADVYGEVDPDQVDQRMATLISSFGQAVVEDRVPEGYLFDANRTRREAEFDIAFQRLVADILDGLPNSAELRRGDVVYRVGFPADMDHHGSGSHGFRALLRGKSSVLGALDPELVDPVGRFHWASTAEQLQLVTDRPWVMEAKARALEARGRGGHEGVG